MRAESYDYFNLSRPNRPLEVWHEDRGYRIPTGTTVKMFVSSTGKMTVQGYPIQRVDVLEIVMPNGHYMYFDSDFRDYIVTTLEENLG